MVRLIFMTAALLTTSNALSQSNKHLYSDYQSLLDSAYIVGELDVFLGVISADTSNPKSIMNRRGEFGDDYSTHSIFGTGVYAGLHGVFSPFNWDCETPPKVFKDSVFVAYLTENQSLSPRISTYSLVGFLDDKAGIKGKAK